MVDKKLSEICKYYLNCLSIEQQKGVSLKIHSDVPEYLEINSIGADCFNENGVVKFLAAQPKNFVFYIGYPIEFSIKKNTMSPVFLFQVTYDAGKATINNTPIINTDVIKKYSAAGIDELIYEVIALEEELGLSDDNSNISLESLSSTLQNIRQWNWCETINPNTISYNVPLSSINEDGIYNKAVVFFSQHSPFTVGLETELKKLSEISEESYKNTALYDWVHNDFNSPVVTSDDFLPLEVLPLNAEQETAVQNALSSKLSVVTGPPGTGKSQVVADILINAAWQNKSVLFSSKNHHAVDVVETRINGIADQHILFKLCDDNTMLSYIMELGDKIDCAAKADIISLGLEKKQYFDIIKSYDEEKSKKDKIIELRNQVDKIEQNYCLIREKMSQYYDMLSEPDLATLGQALERFQLSYDAAQKWKNKFERLIWFVIKNRRKKQFIEAMDKINEQLEKYGETGIIEYPDGPEFDYHYERVNKLYDNLKLTYEYKIKLDDLMRAQPLEVIDKKLVTLKCILAEKANIIWKEYLNIKFKGAPTGTIKTKLMDFISAIKLFGADGVLKAPELVKKFEDINKELTPFLPCWAITSLSAHKRIPLVAGMFDLVVVDEASQCDIASIIPLLYRAKNAVIIGDNKQLGHICSMSETQDAKLIQKYEVEYSWSYKINSLFDKARGLSEKTVKLLDHHRSFADIINFSNKEFYDGKLRVATKYEKLCCPKNIKTGIHWENIYGEAEHPYEGSLFNRSEAKRIVELLKEKIVADNFCGTVGVVTPFRPQADLIRKMISQDIILFDCLKQNNDILVDTIHKFQGDERDVIFFSSVISNGTQKGQLDFLKRTSNIFNVAITRARSSLVVVGNKDYCKNSGVQYLSNFVNYYDSITQESKKDENKPVSYDVEVSEWENILYSALRENGICTVQQFPEDKYKLDLALFDGERKLDIEVDGEAYHKDWNGELCYRDRLRNERLMELGWDVKRFWVYQIRDELPWCIQQVKQWLNN